MHFLLHTINIWKSFCLLFSSWCNFLSWSFLSWCNFDNAFSISWVLPSWYCAVVYDFTSWKRDTDSHPNFSLPTTRTVFCLFIKKDLGTNKYEINPTYLHHHKSLKNIHCLLTLLGHSCAYGGGVNSQGECN